jgi:hypothetical protein
MNRKLLAILAVVLLSIPSALGVYAIVSTTRGQVAGWLAAIGIELAYLTVVTLRVPRHLQKYSQWVARIGVATAIVLNILADYSLRVPGVFQSSSAFLSQFDWVLFLLSILVSIPLPGLAFAIMLLLHELEVIERSINDTTSTHPVTADRRNHRSSRPVPRRP